MSPSPQSVLELSGESIAVSVGGPLDAEYALFDPGDIELRANGPGTTREVGYRTTVGDARQRLAQLGLTVDAAARAAVAAAPSVARAFARGPAVRRIVDRLLASELFDGRTYDATTGRYAGAWLDLAALSGALAPRVDRDACSPSSMLQGLHLAAVLAERRDEEAITLVTADITIQRRPGERTFRRPRFGDVAILVAALESLKGGRAPDAPDDGPTRRDVVRWLRERAGRDPSSAQRCQEIESALETRERPARGPLAGAELWGIEEKLSAGDLDGVAERIGDVERRHGRLPATIYLRARAALLSGSEDVLAIAQHVSALSTSMDGFHELELLAAQAWVHAGDVRRAQAFARDLSDNASVSDTLRMYAREILDGPGDGSDPAVVVIPKAPLAPSGTELHLQPTSRPPPPPSTDAASDSAVVPAESAVGGVPRLRRRGEQRPSDDEMPSIRVEEGRRAEDGEDAGGPLEETASTGAREAATVVESLSIPFGLYAEPPPDDEPPRTPEAARLVFTFLARELGREVRLRHGVELRTDVEGLELAQRFLHEAVGGEAPADEDEEREVLRHAAFVSELLARRLGARWVDVTPADPAEWAMAVPQGARALAGGSASGAAGAPSFAALAPAAPAAKVARIWPVGRVLRFVAQRHRERDLVSYYLELEAFAR